MQQSYLMQQRGVSRVAETEVKGLLHETIDHLVADFGRLSRKCPRRLGIVARRLLCSGAIPVGGRT